MHEEQRTLAHFGASFSSQARLDVIWIDLGGLFVIGPFFALEMAVSECFFV
jgi:hypothetical protein